MFGKLANWRPLQLLQAPLLAEKVPHGAQKLCEKGKGRGGGQVTSGSPKWNGGGAGIVWCNTLMNLPNNAHLIHNVINTGL